MYFNIFLNKLIYEMFLKCYSLNNEEKQSIFTRELIGDLIIMEKVDTSV